VTTLLCLYALCSQNEDLLQEHRVRFLSFLGINPKDEKYVDFVCVCVCVCVCSVV